MTNNQLHPLQANLRGGEPFLRLRHHQNIILTPPRPSDTSCYLPILNDPRVHEELTGPPIPFLPEHAEAFFAKAQALSDAVLTELNASKGVEIPLVVGHCPVNAIREVKEDGEDAYLGDISLRRCTDLRLLGALVDDHTDEGKNRLASQNSRRNVGDPEIIWTIGCYLIPSHHGQGIMTDAIKTLIQTWAVPRMKVRRILVGAFGSNTSSVRVFQKNDFILKTIINNEGRRKSRDLHIFKWNGKA